MDTKYMNIHSLKTHEIEKSLKTLRELPLYDERTAKVVNILFALNYHVGEFKDHSDDFCYFQHSLRMVINSLPYLYSNIFDLLRRGSYAEAVIVYRSVLDSVVVFKYYLHKGNGRKLLNYITRKSNAKLFDLYELIVPGFYDKYYKLLSGSAHGNPFHLDIFRNFKSKKYIEFSGEINIVWLSVVWNQMYSLLPGIIQLYNSIFTENTLESDTKLVEDISNLLNNVLLDEEGRILSHPSQEQIINMYKTICNF